MIAYIDLYAEAELEASKGSEIFYEYIPGTDLELAKKYMALGSLEQKIKKYDRAIKYYDQALEILSRIGEKHTGIYALLLYLKSISEFRLGRFCNAKMNVREAIVIYQMLGDLDSALHAEKHALPEFTNACNSLTFNSPGFSENSYPRILTAD
ncbi:tetratricopeptide repeat protein [Leptospira broomii serovar Hurstbridge str. 5399]|uniref:Tetratricopeptide repeat protein n=2 Tax=Leptospira broomii TaxID=301541 RepID=T0GEG5_9LEPT|nr:tetratricopeptide repeat protein [Leptospira broomii serovar Hurstbridge str. 5399]